jgi:hypothetical protein
MADDPSATGQKADPYDVDLFALVRAVPLKRILIGIVVGLAALYLGDSASIHLRSGKFDTVTVTRFYAVQLKGSKIDFQPADSADVQCVNSLFPHLGESPCWYLRRHKDVRIDM